MREITITGTGRCGTMYAAQLLTSAGIECGHEERYTPQGKNLDADKPADSSWMAAPFARETLHLVRNPLDTIRSLLRMRLFSDGDYCPQEYLEYRAFAYKHTPGLSELSTEQERATAFYIVWNRICQRNASVRVRVEDGVAGIMLGMREMGVNIERVEEPPEDTNTRKAFPASFDPYSLPPEMHGKLVEIAQEYGYNIDEVPPEPLVYWGMPLERYVQDVAVNHLINIAGNAALNGYQRIALPYARIDSARNDYARAFVNASRNPNDTLVMLDNDHAHPMDIIERLAERPEGVVGALYFMRGDIPRPCFFVRRGDELHHIAEWEPDTVYKCAIVGTGAIAIKRWVFDKLESSGYRWPWFKYEYPDGMTYSPTEDIYFGKICEKAGISHHVHTGVVTPHLGVKRIDESTWNQFYRRTL